MSVFKIVGNIITLMLRALLNHFQSQRSLCNSNDTLNRKERKICQSGTLGHGAEIINEKRMSVEEKLVMQFFSNVSYHITNHHIKQYRLFKP